MVNEPSVFEPLKFNCRELAKVCASGDGKQHLCIVLPSRRRDNNNGNKKGKSNSRKKHNMMEISQNTGGLCLEDSIDSDVKSSKIVFCITGEIYELVLRARRRRR